MKSRKSISVAVVLILGLLASILPACSPYGRPVTSYVAVVPRVLQAGSQGAVSLTLFGDEGLISGKVEMTLLKDGEKVARTSPRINGKG